MKKVLILVAIFAITAGATAQLKVTNAGNVGVGTNSPDPDRKLHVLGSFLVDFSGGNWERAIWAKVHNKSTCSYNLWNTYYNKDVFFVCGEGYLWTMKGGYFGSDRELKKNITPIEDALNKAKNLQGVRFQYREGNEEEGEGEESPVIGNEDFRLGFIAQDVELIFPEAVKDMHDGTKAMSYTDLIPVLVEAIKEQQTQIELGDSLTAVLAKTVNKQQIQIENLQRMVDKQADNINFLKEWLEKCCQEGDKGTTSPQNSPENTSPNENTMKSTESFTETAKLFQNIPNPFSVNTEIRFEIPENATTAKLIIHDMQGAEIASYNITAKGAGNIIIQAHELPAGMYMYTLLVNNTMIDTKKMILTK